MFTVLNIFIKNRVTAKSRDLLRCDRHAAAPFVRWCAWSRSAIDASAASSPRTRAIFIFIFFRFHTIRLPCLSLSVGPFLRHTRVYIVAKRLKDIIKFLLLAPSLRFLSPSAVKKIPTETPSAGR